METIDHIRSVINSSIRRKHYKVAIEYGMLLRREYEGFSLSDVEALAQVFLLGLCCSFYAFFRRCLSIFRLFT